jgi:hypothetical protein
MGGEEEDSKLSESLKIGLGVFVELVGQVIQICKAIFDDSDPLGIKSFRAIEEIHGTSAYDGIQRHQRSLMLASHSRPALFLVEVPERQHRIPIHSEVLNESRCDLTQNAPP